MNDCGERKPYAIGHINGNKIDNSVVNLEWVKMPIIVSDGSICLDDTARTDDDILRYLNEAFDKVWLMRTHTAKDCDVETARLKNVERVLKTYPDIPDKGFGEWECGYWNGILAALRWVLGDDKDFLDT